MDWASLQIVIVLVLVVVVFFGFIRERLPPDVVALSGRGAGARSPAPGTRAWDARSR